MSMLTREEMKVELILVENNIDRAHPIWEVFRACMPHILLYGYTREKPATFDKDFERKMHKGGVSPVDTRQFLRSVVLLDAWKFNAIMDPLYDECRDGAPAYVFLMNLNLEDREVLLPTRLTSLFVDGKRIGEGNAPRTFVYTTMERYCAPAEEYFGNHYVAANPELQGIIDVESNPYLEDILRGTLEDRQ